MLLLKASHKNNILKCSNGQRMNQSKRLTNSKIVKVNVPRLLPLSPNARLYCLSSLTAYNSARKNPDNPLTNATKKNLKPSLSNKYNYSSNWQVVQQGAISGYFAEKITFLVTFFLTTEFSFKTQNDNAVILGFLNKHNEVIHKDKSTPHNSNNKSAIYSQYDSLGKYYAQ